MDSSARISPFKWSFGVGLVLSDPLFAQGAYRFRYYKRLLGAGAYNLQSISTLLLNKIWPLEIIAIAFTWDFIPYIKIFDTSSRAREHGANLVQGTCSEDIQVNIFGMQKFTRFYEIFAYC